MDRLTFDGNFCDIALCSETPGGSFCEDGYCSQRKVWERLKQYEDTKFEPEEVKEIAYTFERYLAWDIEENRAEWTSWLGRVKRMVKENHSMSYELRKYKTAEAEGRLYMPPCKVGDTVYEHDCVRIYESVITSIIITDNRLLFHTTGVGFDETAIGSSIFLTREEAQMALEGSSNK